MDFPGMLNSVSLITGAGSAVLWVIAATVKVGPPDEFKGKPDNMYRGHIIANGIDLIPTIKSQARWNSWAAFAAALTALLQVASKFAV